MAEEDLDLLELKAMGIQAHQLVVGVGVAGLEGRHAAAVLMCAPVVGVPDSLAALRTDQGSWWTWAFSKRRRCGHAVGETVSAPLCRW